MCSVGLLSVASLFVVDNWSNGLTKPETAEQLNTEAEIYQVQVTP
jgi:hypothetical protein